MVDISALKATNAARWTRMKLRPERVADLYGVAKRLVGAKDRYALIERRLITLGFYVPWWVIAVIHEREANQRWDRQLAQGDPLGQVSTHVPADRGPFYGVGAFERSCLDALIDCAPHAAKWKDWTPGGTLTILEEQNGTGYAARGVPSAYVWSGTDQYEHGKFVADHVYRDSAVDVQEGCAGLIFCMRQIDKEITFSDEAQAAPPSTPTLETIMNFITLLTKLPAIITDIQKYLPVFTAAVQAVEALGKDFGPAAPQAVVDHLTPGKPNAAALNG